MNAAHDLPGSVLFVCSMNAVRSPMAAAILQHLRGANMRVESVGIRTGDPDPFVTTIMHEIGIDLSSHKPRSIQDVADNPFDLIITLTPEAHHQALELTRTMPAEVEYWPTQDPTTAIGHAPRNQVLEAYREVRDQLFDKIRKRFSAGGSPGI